MDKKNISSRPAILDAVYDDEDVLAALATQPEVVCSVNKDAVVGDEFPVSVQLPEKVSFDNFELVSIVPDVAGLLWLRARALRGDSA